MDKQLKLPFPVKFLLALILITLQGCSGPATGPTGAVSYPLKGTVTDSTTHTPIYPAIVRIGSQSVATSPDGSFSFSYSELQSGNYTLTVDASGYDSLSRQIKVLADTSETIDLSLQALKERISIGATILRDSSSTSSFTFDDYPFIQCEGDLTDHSVKVDVRIDTATHPLSVIVVKPDGGYELEETDTDTGWVGEFTSDLCGTWAVVVSDSGNAPVSFSGYLQLDFSHYAVSGSGVSSSVLVPVNYVSIASGDTASFSRYLQPDMSYELRLDVSGGGTNDIVLKVFGRNSNPVLSKRIDGEYVSQTMLASQAGFYKFLFINDSPDTSRRSLAGVLSIGG